MSLKSAGEWGDVERGGARVPSSPAARTGIRASRTRDGAERHDREVGRGARALRALDLDARRRTSCARRSRTCSGSKRDQVIVREVAVGGGFGSKSKISEHEVLAAALARKTGRPVRSCSTRDEEFATTKTRHDVPHADGGAGRPRRARSVTSRRAIACRQRRLQPLRAVGHAASACRRSARCTGPDGAAWDARLVDTAQAARRAVPRVRRPAGHRSRWRVPDGRARRAARRRPDSSSGSATRNQAGDVDALRRELDTARLVECLSAVRRRDRLGREDARGAHGPRRRRRGRDARQRRRTYDRVERRATAAIDLYADGHVARAVRRRRRRHRPAHDPRRRSRPRSSALPYERRRGHVHGQRAHADRPGRLVVARHAHDRPRGAQGRARTRRAPAARGERRRRRTARSWRRHEDSLHRARL